jgi:hypothetical protein
MIMLSVRLLTIALPSVKLFVIAFVLGCLTIWVSCRCGAGKEHFLTYLFRWRGTRTLRCEAAVGFTHMLAASVNVRV